MAGTTKKKRKNPKDAMIVSGKQTQKSNDVRKIVPGFKGLIRARKKRMEDALN